MSKNLYQSSESETEYVASMVVSSLVEIISGSFSSLLQALKVTQQAIIAIHSTVAFNKDFLVIVISYKMIPVCLVVFVV